MSVLAGAALSGGGGLIGAGIAMAAAKKQRKWAKKMYGSRYQQTVKDLRLAGLNPALAYSQGAGSTPSGASASIPSIDLAGGVSAVSQAILQKKQGKNITALTLKATQDTATAVEQERHHRELANKEMHENVLRKLKADAVSIGRGTAENFVKPGAPFRNMVNKWWKDDYTSKERKAQETRKRLHKKYRR